MRFVVLITADLNHWKSHCSVPFLKLGNPTITEKKSLTVEKDLMVCSHVHLFVTRCLAVGKGYRC